MPEYVIDQQVFVNALKGECCFCFVCVCVCVCVCVRERERDRVSERALSL